MAKGFTWVVRFTVAPLWVADGFTIDDERALDILARAVGGATGDELRAQVIHAPSPLRVARTQGYTPKHHQSGEVVRGLIKGSPANGTVHNALIAARNVLNSIAFVAKEGDTRRPLALIADALAALDCDDEFNPAE